MRLFLAFVAICTGHVTLAFFLVLWKVLDR